jgi:ubiquinone/menaquinone biosynthesis C-methylase UbiE
MIDLWKENGSPWMFRYLCERLFGEKFGAARIRYEIKHQLPGFNTRRYNHKEWTNYDWAAQGEEWNDSDAWKDSVINDIIHHNFSPGKRILEIGPGGGRWSLPLASIASQLYLVDLTEVSISLVQEKLSAFRNCTFLVNGGNDLRGIEDNSIDYIWSFDVFVHIAPEDIKDYIVEFNRVLKSGGLGIIHHAGNGGFNGGFRSSMTRAHFISLLKKNRLEPITQISEWGPNLEFNVHKFNDTITFFKKP